MWVGISIRIPRVNLRALIRFLVSKETVVLHRCGSEQIFRFIKRADKAQITIVEDLDSFSPSIGRIKGTYH